jgi:hypothetical protein
MSEINQDVEGQGFDDGGVFSQQRPVKIAEEGTGDVKKSSKRKSRLSQGIRKEKVEV